MMFLIPPVQSGEIALSSLDLSAVEQEWSSAKRNQSVDEHPLTIAGKKYANGIGTHASSTFNIAVNGNALRFRAVVGVDDEATNSASVQFLVYVDGRKGFDSGVMRKGVAKTVDVDLKGAKTVRFAVEDGGDGIDNDHADWADAMLTLKDPTKKPSTNVAVKEATMDIAPVDTVHTAIHGPRVIGGTPGRDFIFRVPATGQGPLKFSYKNLPAGITATGDGRVLRGSVPSEGRHTFTVTVSGPEGTDQRDITVVSGTHKLAQTPPMGWNSWNVWGLSVTADKVRAAADAFVRLGLADHGYNYVNIDDGWEAGRDANGEVQTNEKFGSMPALATYVHGLGMKLGIYSSPGITTCGGYLGSLNHEAQDAATYAKWGVDYLKYDWCSYGQESKGDNLIEYKRPYLIMREGLDKADRDIVYSLCQYGMGNVWGWGESVGGDVWRTTGDITDTWASMSSIGFSHSDRGYRVGPSAYNDPDMLVVGRLGWGSSPRANRLGGNEQITHITLWSMLAAPLLIGCDLTQIDDFTQRLLMNHDVIEVDQDPLGKPATRVHQDGSTEVWARPLADGSYAVALFNRGPSKTNVEVKWERDLELRGGAKVRDLWRRRDLGTKASGLSVAVPAHGAMMFRVTGE
jgi:alpha-galactosidase